MGDIDYQPLRYPPEGEAFNSWEEGFEWCRDFAQKCGYGIRKGRTRQNKSKEVKHITIQCDRKETPNPTNTVRQTGSRGTSCPFEFNLKSTVWGWEVKHRLDHNLRAHNHPASTAALAHPVHRRAYRNDGVSKEIQSMYQLAIQPSKILTHLARRDTDNALINSNDIHNLLASTRFERRQGMTPIQAFYSQMTTSPSWHCLWDLGHFGDVKRVFFMHEEQLNLLRRYPDIALADCTYKTNRYKMPLLSIIGITPLDTNFPTAFSFLSGEHQDDFEWAMNAFKQVSGISINTWLTDRQLALKNAVKTTFPSCQQLLCLWHVNKNVLGKVQKTWEMPYLPTDEQIKEIMGFRDLFISRWHALTQTKTTNEFDTAWEKLQADYQAQAELIHYLDSEWIPRRFEWAIPWTCRVLHFGNTATSRLEGTHKDIKTYISTPGSDFSVIVERIENYVVKEIHRFNSDLAEDRIRTPHAVVSPACPITTPLLISKVSNAGLQHLAKQYKLAIGEHNPTCTGNFTRSFGIPCCHTIKAILEFSRFKWVELKDIDPHWYYERPTSEDLSYDEGHDILLRIRAPEMARQRRTRQELYARRADDNTAREPCEWERQQTQEEAQITRARAQRRPRGQRGARSSQGRQRGGQGSQVEPPQTPQRSPSIDLSEYFDAVEDPVISPLRQPLAERDPQRPSGAGTSTPSGQSHENTRGSPRRGGHGGRGRGRGRGSGRGRGRGRGRGGAGEHELIENFNQVTDGGVFEAFRL